MEESLKLIPELMKGYVNLYTTGLQRAIEEGVRAGVREAVKEVSQRMIPEQRERSSSEIEKILKYLIISSIKAKREKKEKRKSIKFEVEE